MLLILILTTILAILIVRHYQKVKKLPPGPFSLPLIGNSPQIVYQLWKTGGVVPMLDSFRKEHGNVFTLWFGPLPHVSIVDYETAYDTFVKHGSRYADRMIPELLAMGRGNTGVLFSNGETWQEMRRFILTTFRNIGVGKDGMEERILEEIDIRFKEIDEIAIDGKTTLNSKDFFDLTIGSVINTILIGKRYQGESKPFFFELRALLEASMEVFAPADLTVPLWFLKYFFPRRYNLIKKVNDNLFEYVGKEAKERLEDENKFIDPENPQDLVDAFILKIRADNGANIYTLTNLQMILMDLWIAGQETTSTTLIAGFNQLMHNPEIMTKVRKEVRNITSDGSRPLLYSDRGDTPYLNAVVAEIQRFASVLNVNFWRINHELVEVAGYQVDGGTMIGAQIGGLHVNDEIFGDITKFNPDRFYKNEKLINQLISFGVGKRSCVGEALAKQELYMVTGNLILRYNISPADGKLPSLEEGRPFSASKRPIPSNLVFERVAK